jgi:hypothetical protein
MVVGEPRWLRQREEISVSPTAEIVLAILVGWFGLTYIWLLILFSIDDIRRLIKFFSATPLDPPRDVGRHEAAHPTNSQIMTIFFAPGSAGTDAGAQALLAYAGGVYGAQSINWLTLDGAYDRSEVPDPVRGRALARARIKAVQDALENAGLSTTYLTRIAERDAAVRIEMPRRA